LEKETTGGAPRKDHLVTRKAVKKFVKREALQKTKGEKKIKKRNSRIALEQV